ncbi:outer membrane protein assembly factor BamE [Thiospirillum jenense]|nr:outer membrane protein assembly factor BamE [Thiospirillum jenense]
MAAGCANTPQPTDYQDSLLSDLPFVYKMTVQQGNIVTEEMVDQLKPGMTQAQVRYLLGTPLLADLFHPNHWHYPYTIKRGHQPMELRQLTLFFEQDALVKIQGTLKPDPERAARAATQPRELVMTVPDWQDQRGLVQRVLDVINLKSVERPPVN